MAPHGGPQRQYSRRTGSFGGSKQQQPAAGRFLRGPRQCVENSSSSPARRDLTSVLRTTAAPLLLSTSKFVLQSVLLRRDSTRGTILTVKPLQPLAEAPALKRTTGTQAPDTRQYPAATSQMFLRPVPTSREFVPRRSTANLLAHVTQASRLVPIRPPHGLQTPPIQMAASLPLPSTERATRACIMYS